MARWRMWRERAEYGRGDSNPGKPNPGSGGTPGNAAGEKWLARTLAQVVGAARGDPGDAAEGSTQGPAAPLGNVAGRGSQSAMKHGEEETTDQPGPFLER